MQNRFDIRERRVGLGQAPYFVAQLPTSALTNARAALEALEAVAEAGGEAVELPCQQIADADVLEALFKRADALDMAVLAAHYDSAVLNTTLAERADAHVLAYPAFIDTAFVAEVARLQRPLIICTEAAELAEIEAAVVAGLEAGCQTQAVLHYVGGDAAAEAAGNLHTLLDMSFRFDSVVGLADRSCGSTVSIAALALGATIIAKPFTLCRNGDADQTPDPEDFRHLVEEGRKAWRALGLITYALTDGERVTRARRSHSEDQLAG